MPLPFDPTLGIYLAAAGGPTVGAGPVRPWPRRVDPNIQAADYYIGESGIYSETVLGVAYVVARTPLFCSHPEAGIDTRQAVPMRRRPGDTIEIHAGVFNPVGFGPTGMVLEVWTAEAPDRFTHWGRTTVVLTAADALIASYGIGRTLEAGPRFWYARLRFPDLEAAPVNPYRLVRWFVSA